MGIERTSVLAQKVIPRVFVPFRYWVLCLVALMWPLAALVVYFARKFVARAISGQVKMAIQLSNTTGV